MRSTSKTIRHGRWALLALLFFTLVKIVAAQATLTPAIGWMGDLTFDGMFLYVTTMAESRPIIKVDPVTGAIVDTIEQNPHVTDAPRGVAFDGIDRLFLTSMTPEVCEFDMSGTVVGCFSVPDPVPNATTGFRTGALAFDGTNLYIGDTDAGTILVTDRSGAGTDYFDSGLRPEGMVFDPLTGHLWVVDLFVTDKMMEITTNGELVRVCDITYNPGPFGLGGITIVGSKFYISEPLNPASPGDGTRIHILERSTLACNPALVVSPEELVQNLIDAINGLGVPFGIQNSLAGPLHQFIEILNDNNPNNDVALCGKLSAFVNQVNAKEKSGQLTADQADDLRQLAEAVEAVLGCP